MRMFLRNDLTNKTIGSKRMCVCEKFAIAVIIY